MQHNPQQSPSQPNPMFETAHSTEAAEQIIEAQLGVSASDLHPLLMMYRNTVLEEAKKNIQ